MIEGGGGGGGSKIGVWIICNKLTFPYSKTKQQRGVWKFQIMFISIFLNKEILRILLARKFSAYFANSHLISGFPRNWFSWGQLVNVPSDAVWSRHLFSKTRSKAHIVYDLLSGCLFYMKTNLDPFLPFIPSPLLPHETNRRLFRTAPQALKQILSISS